MNLGKLQVRKSKISNFVFSLLCGQKPVPSEFTGTKGYPFWGGGVRVDLNGSPEKNVFWIIHVTNLDFSCFSRFRLGKVVFSRNRREGGRIGPGKVVASRW